jgi:hypothetical protein
LLSTRVQTQILDAKKAKFDSAIRLFGTKEKVRVYNHTKLRDLSVPVVNITASHTGHKKAVEVSTEEAGNLQPILSVSINATVMLTENIWVTKGLVNGRTGFVRDIVWGGHVTSPRIESPDILLLYIPGYNGPCYKKVNSEKLVPIYRSKREFMYRGHQACTRTQFPVVLAYAITVHKSQGLSIDKAVLNITDREFVPGLTYVAVSCVRSLSGLLFEQGFNFSRFKPRKLKTKQMRHEDTLRRRKQEISVDIRMFTIKIEGDEDNDDDKFPYMSAPQAPSGSFFELPLRPSSPTRGLGLEFLSDTFGGEDVGMSGMAAPPTSDEVIVYPNNWLMDESSQLNPYFNCFSCNFARPSNYRHCLYSVCVFCHGKVAAALRERWCMGCNQRRPELSFFTADYNVDKNVCGKCGRFDSIDR